ncbi:MAG: GDSL-type esterase/lipase family protein [Puniceicoccales bacterium]|jgi:lysophospholipase L1-like esterase|nr:GDSL-type esterase/lipase family protein [Puniceicoccales bacterium]
MPTNNQNNQNSLNRSQHPSTQTSRTAETQIQTTAMKKTAMRRTVIKDLFCLLFAGVFCAGMSPLTAVPPATGVPPPSAQSTPSPKTPQAIYVVFIGDSITAGALVPAPKENAPPAKAAAWLAKQSAVELRGFSNQGVSGYTTVDFLPSRQKVFQRVERAAARFAREDETARTSGDRKGKAAATLVFSVMLGTNDSACSGTNGAPVSPEHYHANLTALINALAKRFPNSVFVLHNPLWYSPSTHNGARYLQEGLTRLESYAPKLRELADARTASHTGKVFLGDTEAFGFFKANAAENFVHEKGRSGQFYLHPNRVGAAKLGEFWAKAILRTLENKTKT